MNKYDDIIDMPYVKSTKRRNMTNSERAAQFAPFAALRGHEESIDLMEKAHESFVENEIERYIEDDI